MSSVFNEKEKMDDVLNDVQKSEGEEDLFQIEDITIEEMAIDGICGVY